MMGTSNGWSLTLVRPRVRDDLQARGKGANPCAVQRRNIGVRLDSADEERYDALSKEVGGAIKKLEAFGLSLQPFGKFMQDVSRLAQSGPFTPDGKAAAAFLRCFSERRQLLADTEVKLHALERLASVIKRSERALIFTRQSKVRFKQHGSSRRRASR